MPVNIGSIMRIAQKKNNKIKNSNAFQDIRTKYRSVKVMLDIFLLLKRGTIFTLVNK